MFESMVDYSIVLSATSVVVNFILLVVIIIALLICLIKKMKKENMLPNDEGLKLYKSAITIDSLYNTIKRTPSKSPQDIPGSQSEIILEKCTEIQTT